MGECLIIKFGSGIDTSNTTALASTILSGYTAYVNDEKVTGSMSNRGSVTSSLDPGESYIVSEGWYDGAGEISVTPLANNTHGTAQAGWILSGYNAWVNGNKLTGTMTNRGNQSWNLAANGTQVIWSGFYDGTGKVSQSLTTSGGGTWTPTTSNKTLVNASTWVSEAWYVAGASTLISANIKKGISIFGVTGTWTGLISGDIYVIKNGVFQNELKPVLVWNFHEKAKPYFSQSQTIVDNALEIATGCYYSQSSQRLMSVYIWFYTGHTTLANQPTVTATIAISGQWNWASTSSLDASVIVPNKAYPEGVEGVVGSYVSKSFWWTIQGGSFPFKTTSYNLSKESSTTSTTGWLRCTLACYVRSSTAYWVWYKVKDLYITV